MHLKISVLRREKMADAGSFASAIILFFGIYEVTEILGFAG